MALNFFGVMLLAPGMAWGTLRERPVPLEVLEPDAWARGDDGLGESIPPAAPRAPRPAPPRAKGIRCENFLSRPRDRVPVGTLHYVSAGTSYITPPT